jgi:hypothetical protein
MKVRKVEVEKIIGEVTCQGVGFRLFKEDLEIQYPDGTAVRVSLEEIAMEATEPVQENEALRVKRTYKKKDKEWLNPAELGKLMGPLLDSPKKHLSTWTVRRLIASLEGVGPHLLTKEGDRKNSTLYSRLNVRALVAKYNSDRAAIKEQATKQCLSMRPLGLAALAKMRREKNGSASATVN